jgi:hypothetical protein
MRELMAAVAVLTCSTLVTAPVAAAVPPAPALMISVEDVRVIAGITDLNPGEQLDRPGGQHQYDGQYPAACGAVLNQDVAFASGFNEFRSVTFNGAASRSVTQAVAVYPDPAAARAALTAVGSALKACSELGASNMAVTTQVLDQKTFALCQTQCATIYRAEGPVLISVSASRFGDSDRIATAVLQRITNRVGE